MTSTGYLSGMADYREDFVNARSGVPDPSLAIADGISNVGVSGRLEHLVQRRDSGRQLQVSEEKFLFGSRVLFHPAMHYPLGGAGNGGLR